MAVTTARAHKARGYDRRISLVPTAARGSDPQQPRPGARRAGFPRRPDRPRTGPGRIVEQSFERAPKRHMTKADWHSTRS